MQGQELFLSLEARRREYQHQQKVIEMQKHLTVEASKQSQEGIMTRSEETITLRREIDESGKFSESMVDWTTSEPY